MNPNLDKLQPYPFEKIRSLLDGAVAPAGLDAISFAIGEPRHPAPEAVISALTDSLDQLSQYPATVGSDALRTAIARWLERRFTLPSACVDANTQVLPVNGTREALFAIAQTVVDSSSNALILSPNPFYQIYEGAALLSGATPYYLNTVADHGFIPDFATVPVSVWQRCQLIYICSPGNPTGSVIPLDTLKQLIQLADEHDFVIAGDECYSEIYPDENNPPPGLLQACAELGRLDFSRCLVFHSLSKRSNLPGLRSGFVAGDRQLLDKFRLYRTYHGCAMSPPVQSASVVAWNDERHVQANRALYRQKFEAVVDILSPVMAITAPDASFYLWPETPIADDSFTRQLFEQQHVRVVPGRYLARDTESGNPGLNRVRMALVATVDECVDGALRMRHFIETL
jgi:N-succinyldiaminopimelate aminotransferase